MRRLGGNTNGASGNVSYSEDAEMFVRLNEQTGVTEYFDFPTKTWIEGTGTELSANPSVRFLGDIETYMGLASYTGIHTLNEHSIIFANGSKIFTPINSFSYLVSSYSISGAVRTITGNTNLPFPAIANDEQTFMNLSDAAIVKSDTAGKYLWFTHFENRVASTHRSYYCVHEIDLTGNDVVVTQIGLAELQVGNYNSNFADEGVQALHLGNNKFLVHSNNSQNYASARTYLMFDYDGAGTATEIGVKGTFNETQRHPSNYGHQAQTIRMFLASPTEILIYMAVAGANAGQYSFARSVATFDTATGVVDFGDWVSDLAFTDSLQMNIDYIDRAPDGTIFSIFNSWNSSPPYAGTSRLYIHDGANNFQSNQAMSFGGHGGSYLGQGRLHPFPFIGNILPILTWGGNDEDSTTRELRKFEITNNTLVEIEPRVRQNSTDFPKNYSIQSKTGRAMILPNGQPITVPSSGSGGSAIKL